VAAVASDSSFLPIPRHVVAQHGDKWTEAGNIVTNGPFTIESWRHDQQMTLTPNPQYWREKPAGKVVVSMTNDPESTSVTAYETDEVDFAWVPPTQLNQVRAHPVLGKDLKSTTLIATWFTVFDTVTPPFNDARVRRAFALSLDRQRLTQAFLQGAFRPATSLTPPGTLGYMANLPAGGGVQEAKKLLAEAGYPDGKGFPEVTYTCSNLERERIVAQALQQMWKEALNVNIKIDVLERRAYQTWRASRKEQPFGMHEGGWTAEFVDPWLFHNQMLSARVDRQNHKWKNSAYEDLIWKASGELNPEKRRALYEQAEQIVLQEAPIIPWGYRLKTYLLKPDVQGLESEATGYVDLFRKVKIVK
jgi:oligopeptide transport system substrate-binding protein